MLRMQTTKGEIIHTSPRMSLIPRVGDDIIIEQNDYKVNRVVWNMDGSRGSDMPNVIVELTNP